MNPTHQSRHAAAIAAGQFSPHYKPEPMKQMNTQHPQPIVTRARTGLPLSTLNRMRQRRARTIRPAAFVFAAVLAFWLVLAAVLFAA